MEKSKVGTSRHRWRRWGQMAMAYLAVAALLTLGALYAVFAGPTIFGARAGAGAAPAQLGVSVGQPRWTSCGQHPGGGQLSDYAGFGRMASDQNRAHSGSTAQPHYGLWDALRGKNVLRRGVGGRLYGYPYQQRCSEPSKNGGPALGDRVIRMDAVATENNDAVKAALEHSQGQPVEVVYVRGISSARHS